MKPLDPFIDPFDAIWKEAEQASPRKTVRNAKLEEPKVGLLPGYADISNWIPGRALSLIHAPTNTLLGNFREHFYPHLPGTRRLVRVSEPVATEGVEEVSGDWWLTPREERGAQPARWIRTCETVVGVTLRECGLHCPSVLVRIRLEFEGIARVELMEPTRFTCPARNDFLTLMPGLDVLAAMDYDSKVALRAQLEEEGMLQGGKEDE